MKFSQFYGLFHFFLLVTFIFQQYISQLFGVQQLQHNFFQSFESFSYIGKARLIQIFNYFNCPIIFLIIHEAKLGWNHKFLTLKKEQLLLIFGYMKNLLLI
ncbi:unnamed protein product [Paramecium primaurelia]|uniref:Uncharacterized protein n=1 Tax=Paramecium primaurelia TaxID=5886 RepID=A0A8S1P3Y6_PARPR|nr:unnamed protein product [Paramecium primaurelia]